MKTRIIFLLVFLCIGCFASAQNTTLTKRETTAYLEKKFMEAEGAQGYLDSDPASIWRYKDFMFTFNNNMLTIGYKMEHLVNKEWVSYGRKSFSFNPLYIKSIDAGTMYEHITTVNIALSLPGIESGTNRQPPESKVNSLHFFYLGSATERSNGEKVKKALLHLQALLKAEDDPFAK